MSQPKKLPSQEAIEQTERLVSEFLSQNPQLASALTTFDVAQTEYRRSLRAITSVQIVTRGTANSEA